MDTLKNLKMGKIKSLSNSSGMTLIEVAVTLSLIAIASAVITISFRGQYARTIQNASVALQADLRYAQRRALITGRRHGVIFEIHQNRYHVVQYAPRIILRTVYFSEGISLLETSGMQLMFLPRGTASAGFRITLRNARYTQQLTATVSGGRIRIFDKIPIQ